ncbi:MAG: type IV pilus assembly protein PilM [Thermodesulfobacteriota bacterium]
MKNWSLWRNKTSPALDLGQGWAKAVCLAGNKKKTELYRLGRMPLRQEELKQADRLGGRIRIFWDSLQMGQQSMVSSLAGHSVIIKQLDLPVRKTRDMQQTILDQAQEYIPFDMQDVYLDFQLMGPGQQEDTQKVILVASKKQMVQDLQDIFSAAGLGALILDVDGFALSNCFEFNYPEYSEQNSYLLDIGSGHSTFCVYAQGQPVLVRDIDLGARQLQEKLASALDRPLQDVEKLHLLQGGDFSAQEQEILAQERERLYLSWSSEIQRLINFYQGSLQEEAQAGRLFLAGGGSLLPGLAGSLAHNLDLEAQHLDPFRSLAWDNSRFDPSYLQSISPQFAVAVGLALRQLV